MNDIGDLKVAIGALSSALVFITGALGKMYLENKDLHKEQTAMHNARLEDAKQLYERVLPLVQKLTDILSNAHGSDSVGPGSQGVGRGRY